MRPAVTAAWGPAGALLLVLCAGTLPALGICGALRTKDSAAPTEQPPPPSSAPRPSTALLSMSVVLPCAFEGVFARKTVESIWNYTEPQALKEIIVVDDGSDPPIETVFDESFFGPGRASPLRILRHNRTLGLIAAKKTGGDAALGDIITFLDCHVKPRMGWERALQRQMWRAGDHRTVVVPVITTLDPDTWEETVDHDGEKNPSVCFLMWNADFTWTGAVGNDVPLMSGGLLALTQQWWQETGGYDPKMVAWGGENIDQTLRTWLCGGRIELARDSFVAHMWRDGSKAGTELKYPMPTEDVMRNKARAVNGWLGPFVDKTLAFPEYENFVSGAQSLGDMSVYQNVRERLPCRPFSDYISRFSYLYEDAGLIPHKIFQLREAQTGLCLERVPGEYRKSHGTVLAPCAEGGESSELQLWHKANRDQAKNGTCCSGIMNWNFLHCLEAPGDGGKVTTAECDLMGKAQNMHFQLADDGQLEWQKGESCVSPRAPALAKTVAKPLTASSSVRVAPVERSDGTHASGFDFRLIYTLEGGVEACGTAVKAGGDPPGELEFSACAPGDKSQLFRAVPMHGGFQIRSAKEWPAGTGKKPQGLCFDSGGGGSVIIYNCYSEEYKNMNQVWQVQGDHLVWEEDGAGVRVAAEPASEAGFVALRACIPKVGQRFRRQKLPGIEGGFAFSDADSSKCLGVGPKRPAGDFPGLVLADCSKASLFAEKGPQLMHVDSGDCLDMGGGDGSVPILYPCHAEAGNSQRWKLNSDGAPHTIKSWGDNGRSRVWEQCLDYKPEPRTSPVISDCSEVRQRGVRWEQVAAREPQEMQLWQAASRTRDPQALPLGL